MRKFLGVIPARRGSKGLPGKNIRDLQGKPLVVWTIEAARAAKSLDNVICSTDDAHVKRFAEIAGVEVLDRPEHLATDEAGIVDVLLHVVERFPEYTDIVLLQPTSPLRSSADIENAIELVKQNPGASLISVTPSRKSPYWSYRIQDGQRIEAIFGEEYSTRRQTLEQTYLPNGAIYISSIENLRKNRKFLSKETIPYVMPAERSVDIDDHFDFGVAEFLVQKHL